uniref:Uncharacterized protein n=1 Tax=Anguilla anguilla TaxID=7936 RepID=A0A0E9RTA3_ANGAN
MRHPSVERARFSAKVHKRLTFRSRRLWDQGIL